MGAQAQADRAWQDDARRVHEADLGAREKRRAGDQAWRDPRCRVRHGPRAMPQVRWGGAGELPEIPMSEMRLFALESGVGPRMVARGSRRAHYPALRRTLERL